jgi:hypothetical protein
LASDRDDVLARPRRAARNCSQAQVNAEEMRKRVAIDFVGHCRVAFKFLEEASGFQCETSDAEIVRYRGGQVTVAVRFDSQRSHELEVEFSFADAPEPPFTLGEVVLFREGAMPQAVQVTTDEAMNRCLGDLARLVQAHATPLLRGDSVEFARLSEQRKRHFDQKQEQQRVEDAVREARSAWTRDDYSTVIRLLAPLDEKLSPAEQKRLALARDRMASGD